MKTKTNIFITILFASLLFCAGCAENPGSGEVIAQIGSERITITDFNERIANLPERYQDVIRSRKKDFLEEIITDTLLYQEAVRQGISKDKEVKKLIEEAQKKIVISRFLNANIDKTITISEDEIIDHYNTNKEAYMRPEIMRVSHILVQDREQAKEILEELEGGADFADMARAKSVDPTAQNGGDIGHFPKGQLIPEFESACVDLEVGDFTGPVKTKLGYHIIMLTDRKEPQQMPLENVKDKIQAVIHAQKRREKFQDMITGLKEKTKISINEEVLEAPQEEEAEKAPEQTQSE